MPVSLQYWSFMVRLPRLILASASPRRREILLAAGFEFEVRPASVPEEKRNGESPVEYVRRLAAEKAAAVAAAAEEAVLGADTVVVAGEEVLEKPRDADHAFEMLRRLSGGDHLVVSGICLRHRSKTVVDHATTLVRFRPLSEEEISDYVDSGEPMGKAGGYAIQGLASKFVERVEGCYFNVVGLPVSLVYAHLLAMRG
jgi:septum formation protein